MDRTEIIQDLESIYRKILEREDIELDDSLTANDIEGWDSLTHAVLIAEVQKHFQVKFKLREVIALKNVGALIDLVSTKLQ